MRKSIFRKIKYLNLESFSFGNCTIQTFPKVNNRVNVKTDKQRVYFFNNDICLLTFELNNVETIFRNKKVIIIRFKDNYSLYLYLN